MNRMNKQENLQKPLDLKKSDKLSSESLAVLIVDAIIDAGLIDKKDFQLALDITTEEIDVRKALGDY